MNKKLGLASMALAVGLNTGCATKNTTPIIKDTLQQVSSIQEGSSKQYELTAKEKSGIFEAKTIDDITDEELRSLVKDEIENIHFQIENVKNTIQMNKIPDIYKPENTHTLTEKEVKQGKSLILQGELYIKKMTLLLIEGTTREIIINELVKEYGQKGLLTIVNEIRENKVISEYSYY